MRLLRFTHNDKGQTMVELVLALGILAMAIASAGALATVSARVGTEGGRRSQAMALATREFEALRHHAEGLARKEEPQTLWDSFGKPANQCLPVVMKRSTNSVTGWETQTSQAGVPYSDASAGEQGYDESGGYSRLVTVCKGKDFDRDNGTYSPSTGIYNVEVKVEWSEGQGATRQLITRSLLTTDTEEVDEE